MWYLKCKISVLRCKEFLSYVPVCLFFIFALSVICYLLMKKVCVPSVCRFFFTSLNGGDVPIIYSPVPFQNSSLNFPEVTPIKLSLLLFDSFQGLGYIDNKFTL